MTVKFITVKGPDRLARAPFYLGIPQHERTMSKREAYEHIALKTGYTSTSQRARSWLHKRLCSRLRGGFRLASPPL